MTEPAPAPAPDPDSAEIAEIAEIAGTAEVAEITDAMGVTEAAEIAGRLRLAIQHLLPVLRARSAPGDLTPSRQAALAALAAHGPLRISELAARMGVALSTVSRMVDLLDSIGWIARHPDPQDQRASLVALSRTGETVLETRRRETAARLAERIALLTDGEQRALYAALPALEALSERAATYPGELPRGI
ncbi:MarR family winged helix-turn-helix transcriptional regulator [Streptomyces sp. NPDC056730]|uniref:MarR family winged helix-turn-helix transcriptional regulator n=1 Tax=unclassified Streptomyces TaxID=2593676 RepID=UPI0036C3D777